jgi:hypothetical protein
MPWTHMAECGYSLTNLDLGTRWSGHLHGSAALTPAKKPPVPIIQVAGWAGQMKYKNKSTRRDGHAVSGCKISYKAYYILRWYRIVWYKFTYILKERIASILSFKDSTCTRKVGKQLLVVYRCFGETYCQHLQDRKYLADTITQRQHGMILFSLLL